MRRRRRKKRRATQRAEDGTGRVHTASTRPRRQRVERRSVHSLSDQKLKATLNEMNAFTCVSCICLGVHAPLWQQRSFIWYKTLLLLAYYIYVCMYTSEPSSFLSPFDSLSLSHALAPIHIYRRTTQQQNKWQSPESPIIHIHPLYQCAMCSSLQYIV